MKAKQAARFVVQAHVETHHALKKLISNGRYTTEQVFYLKLGVELSMASVATLVGANNSEPQTGQKWYLHSPRKPKTPKLDYDPVTGKEI